MKKGLISKSAYARFAKGHPWIFATDILQKSALPQRPCAFLYGDVWWLFSPASFIRMRRLGPAQEKWMYTPRFSQITNADQFIAYFGDWLQKHLVSTLIRKIQTLSLTPEAIDEDLCLRWIFSENDLLPGLIVDIFGDNVVCQINSAPVEVFWHHMRATIDTAFTAVTGRKASILDLRSAPVRKKEGLEIISPDPTREVILRWNGLKWLMTPAGTQKTGAYFDQRLNHRLAAQYALATQYKEAWDLCTFQGGFALHLLHAGLSVTAVDQSADALALARKNTQLNDLPCSLLSTVCTDVFEWLQKKQQEGARTDMIILDPPSFVKNREGITGALRGYKELNTHAFQCLKPNGMLVSCVCSHHISEEQYKRIIHDSAQSAGVKIQVLKFSGPSPDHMPIKGFSEGHYLQAWFIQVLK